MEEAVIRQVAGINFYVEHPEFIRVNYLLQNGNHKQNDETHNCILFAAATTILL